MWRTCPQGAAATCAPGALGLPAAPPSTAPPAHSSRGFSAQGLLVACQQLGQAFIESLLGRFAAAMTSESALGSHTQDVPVARLPLFMHSLPGARCACTTQAVPAWQGHGHAIWHMQRCMHHAMQRQQGSSCPPGVQQAFWWRASAAESMQTMRLPCGPVARLAGPPPACSPRLICACTGHQVLNMSCSQHLHAGAGTWLLHCRVGAPPAAVLQCLAG